MPRFTEPAAPTILIVGASRGLGHALAAEFVARGWNVIGTVRGRGRTELHALAEAEPGKVAIEMLDMDAPDQIAALRGRLADRPLDMLYVNAGTAPREPDAHAGLADVEEFTRVILTNALGPLRVIEALQDIVRADGLIGAMSSGQGSIANSENGRNDVYRASKAALNMLIKTAAARQPETRALALIAPGWIRTELGGPDAPFTMEEAVPMVVDVLLAKRDRPGLEYLDRFGKTVPW